MNPLCEKTCVTLKATFLYELSIVVVVAIRVALSNFYNIRMATLEMGKMNPALEQGEVVQILFIP